MILSRRKFCSTSVFVALGTLIAARTGKVFATPEEVRQKIEEFTSGVKPKRGGITLKIPEIAENGNAVPLSFSVDSPMTTDSFVESVMITAEDNPLPVVATFHFTPASGIAEASTRIRLAQTQNVIAVAKMNDGSFITDMRHVKVTIGGCGG